VQLQAAGFDLRQIEQVIDQLEQRLSRVAEDLDMPPLFRRQRGFGQQLGNAEQRVHRRADFVAHVGQELALGAAGFSGYRTLVAEPALRGHHGHLVGQQGQHRAGQQHRQRRRPMGLRLAPVSPGPAGGDDGGHAEQRLQRIARRACAATAPGQQRRDQRQRHQRSFGAPRRRCGNMPVAQRGVGLRQQRRAADLAAGHQHRVAEQGAAADEDHTVAHLGFESAVSGIAERRARQHVERQHGRQAPGQQRRHRNAAL
jgi:hypothetical protein